MSTYRVQIRPDFDLDAAADLAPYLSALGVTHLYSAPLLAATPGSPHGYDVVDPGRTNPELGGREALDRLVATLRWYRLGLVVDIVPNHLGVARPECNPAWWSVLREGPDSPYAAWFDIDWRRGKLTVPVLGTDDDLDRIEIDGDELHYAGHRYPIAPGTSGGTAREVHDRQHYRLIDGRRGNTEVNYRRFFAVSDLAGVRVEDPVVRDATHAEFLSWVRDGLVDGVRVDHPDGLRDPAGYLRWLRSAIGSRWLVVEKILAYREHLPPSWPVDGTTGYDALRAVCGVFVDPEAERCFPAAVPFAETVLAAKREAATTLLAAELTRLTGFADPPLPHFREALAEIAAHLAVYRTYPDPADPDDQTPTDRIGTDTADPSPGGRRSLVAPARPPGEGTHAGPDGRRSALAERPVAEVNADRERLRAALAAAYPAYPDAVAAIGDELLSGTSELARRFPQYSGAVMAKGVEDMAFYRWTRFVAHNEVGGAPDRFGVAPDEFHATAAAYPSASMTTLSTHDTKRGEDVRARLAVLAEAGAAWREQVDDWSERYPLGDAAVADLLWQTAVGAWPIERERLHAYAEKAAREAATATTWDAPDDAFEARMHAMIDALYDDEYLCESIGDLVAQITPAGWSNALSQKLVQLTMPGVPDVYQGTELWENSLVNPDNRRPVDFAERAELLAALDAGTLPPVDATGAAKLLVTSRALRLRRDRPDLFTTYRPVAAHGPRAAHVLAYDRGGAVTVVTRLPLRLAAAGGFTAEDRLDLPAGTWRDELTGTVATGALAGWRYPVALLVRERA